MGRQAMIEFKGSHFEREVILWGPCRNLHAKSADLESVMFQYGMTRIVGPPQVWGWEGQSGIFASVV
jgi:hypothetical protein